MRTILILLSLTFLFSCSKVKELEDRTKNMEETMEKMEKTTTSMSNTTTQMKDTMGKMEQTTTGMSNTTTQMSDTMDNMNENTTNMYLQIRQKEAADTRNKEMANLTDKYTDMGAKLTAGKKYFYSFEYQLWTGRGVDNEEYRNELIEEAMEEFYRMLNDLYSDYEAVSPVDIDSANIRTKAFYALATTMHFNNLHQVHNVKKYNKNNAVQVEELSIYEILKSALAKYNNTETTLELTPAEVVAVRGFNIKITEALLNARMNFITALGVKDVVTKDHMSYGDMGRGLLYQMSRGRFGSLNLDSKFEVQNVYTQADVRKKLDGALKTKKIIVESNFIARLDGKISSIIKNLHRPETSEDDGSQNQEEDDVYGMLSDLTK